MQRSFLSRLGGPIGAGSSRVSGKKTESKLVQGEVGVSGERWWKRFSTIGEDVLGEFLRVWSKGLVWVKEGWLYVRVEDS